MAKSSRSSTRKANNQRLAAKVFGPAQAAREERLSAKLLEVAKQPKPESSDVNMNSEWSRLCISILKNYCQHAVQFWGMRTPQTPRIRLKKMRSVSWFPIYLLASDRLTHPVLSAMDVDPKQPKEHTNRNRIGKRKQKKTNKIVFQKYGDRQRSKK